MELICFDMDGTLVDSDKLHIFAFRKSFKDYNLPDVKDSKVKSLFGATDKVIAKTLFPQLSEKELAKVSKEYNEFVIKYADKKLVQPFPGVKKVLKELSKSYKLGVLSNCSHEEINVIIRAAGIDLSLFEIIVGNDDVEHGKPWPDEIFKAEKLTHHKVDYMVGDSIYDIMAGKRAGCKTIAVLTGHYNRKRLNKEKPDFIIKSVKEIIEVLKYER